MKNLLFVCFFWFSCFCLTAQETEINGCRITAYYGNETHEFSAYGDVYVETDPTEPVDIYVKIVDSPQMATYKVFKTTDTPQKCGEWRFVTDRTKARFVIRYVKEPEWWEDCTIFFVNNRSKAGFY